MCMMCHDVVCFEWKESAVVALSQFMILVGASRIHASLRKKLRGPAEGRLHREPVGLPGQKASQLLFPA